jgi:predicted RNA-binding protein (virulence factor B family)
MPPYQPGEEVEVMAWQKTDLGYKVIVDNKFSGLVYQKEIFKALEPGMRMTAYIRQVREDGRLTSLSRRTVWERSVISVPNYCNTSRIRVDTLH